MNVSHRAGARLWRRGLSPAVLGLTVLAMAAACGADPTTQPPSANSYPNGTVTVPLGDRPFGLFVPSGYRPESPLSLVVGLHGYTSDSRELASYFSLTAQAEQRGFLVALPDGTIDRAGDQFWNATNACCDIYGSGVDDSTYLSQLIDAVRGSYAVDRVFVIGHSNGGYMANRLACDHADQITAIASLAGPMWNDPVRCNPSRPVSVLYIHGTADETVAFAGGSFGPGADFPAAEDTVANWRELDGCADAGEAGGNLDLDNEARGAETAIISFTERCRAGSRVEFWRMQGSHHVPALTGAFAPAVVDFFFSSAAG